MNYVNCFFMSHATRVQLSDMHDIRNAKCQKDNSYLPLSLMPKKTLSCQVTVVHLSKYLRPSNISDH